MSDTFEEISSIKTSNENMNFAQVIFQDIQEQYEIKKDFECKYVLTNTMHHNSRDWVGLYKVGWSNAKDYVYYQWAGKPIENEPVKIIFPHTCVPGDDNEFYQFCYITSNGSMRGASMPFQFLNPLNDELIEMEDAGLMIVKKRTTFLEEQMNKILQEKEHLNDQLTQFKIVCSQFKNNKLEDENKIDYLQSDMVSAHEMIKKLEMSIEFYHKNLAIAKNDLEETKKILVVSEDTIQKLMNDLQCSEQQLQAINQKEVDSLKKNENFETERSNLIEKITSLQAISAERSEKEHEFINKISKKQNELQELEKKYVSLYRAYEDLTKTNKAEALMVSKYKMDCLNLEERIANTENKLSAAEKSKDLLNQEYQTLSACFKDIREENTLYGTEMNKLKNKIETLQDEKSNDSAQIILYEEKIKQLNNTLGTYGEKINSLNVENSSLKSNLTLLKEEHQTQIKMINEEKDQSVEGSQEALASALNEISPRYLKLQKKNKELVKALVEMGKSQDSLIERNNVLAKEKEDLTTRLGMAGEEYRSKYKECMKLEKSKKKLNEKIKVYEENLECEKFSSQENFATPDERTNAYINDLLLEQERYERHLKRVQEQAKDDQMIIEKLNAELTSSSNINSLLKNKLDKIMLEQKRNQRQIQVPVYEEKDCLPEPLTPERLYIRKEQDAESVDEHFEDAISYPLHACPVCNSKLMSLEDLELHVGRHDFQKSCPICNTLLDLVSQSEYEKHVENHFN